MEFLFHIERATEDGTAAGFVRLGTGHVRVRESWGEGEA
jgi:hypothetical protein